MSHLHKKTVSSENNKKSHCTQYANDNKKNRRNSYNSQVRYYGGLDEDNQYSSVSGIISRQGSISAYSIGDF